MSEEAAQRRSNIAGSKKEAQLLGRLARAASAVEQAEVDGRNNIAAKRAARDKLILLAIKDLSNVEVARASGVSRGWIYKLKKREV